VAGARTRQDWRCKYAQSILPEYRCFMFIPPNSADVDDVPDIMLTRIGEFVGQAWVAAVRPVFDLVSTVAISKITVAMCPNTST
jgi:hypothetical protein